MAAQTFSSSISSGGGGEQRCGWGSGADVRGMVEFGGSSGVVGVGERRQGKMYCPQGGNRAPEAIAVAEVGEVGAAAAA